MPLMINFMQGNLGAGMTGSNSGPDTALPPPPPGGDTGPGAPVPPSDRLLGQHLCRRRSCPACSPAG